MHLGKCRYTFFKWEAYIPGSIHNRNIVQEDSPFSNAILCSGLNRLLLKWARWIKARSIGFLSVIVSFNIGQIPFNPLQGALNQHI